MSNSAPQLQLDSTTRAFLWVCIAGCIAFLVWASIGRLDIVSMAEGEVVPSSLVKRVQHLEGGIIREIKVREGEVVTQGQELVELEGTQQGSSVEEVRVRLSSLQVDLIRYQAMADMARELVMPVEIEATLPEKVTAARELFASSMATLAGQLAEYRQQVIQTEQDVRSVTVRISKQRDALVLLRKELGITEQLFKEQLATELKYIQLQREVTNLESRIEQDKANLGKMRAQYVEAVAAVERVESQFREKARQDLRKAQQEYDELSERMKKFEDTLKRTVLRSPVDGVVKQLAFAAPGEVVEPGGTVMTIVPTSDKLVVEAHLPINDIGYVALGQNARISLTSADARRFGRINGTVVRISPDVVVDRQGNTYYKVRIETDDSCFEREGNRYCLYPGMIVACSIHTGSRTVLEYILSPFMSSLTFSMQER
ncbi:HlyD family type I secretion periplasmic adaptor subunit [Desulfovibrio mangrovi]|uniref:HlyD family type I secretion periplasmic adaptor subunit n=1 Tax=Desulfovibrio mangrovi TaxID=2976983 RepID=UPI0022461868|nr:HlyD family type I secretion periplasmic adaptor subunit [Desulfovibrio mangrovi]UZP68838.1 HlyD family type I secretion periplasmic adaptor subunit [Desulfovibrio mangrovi]